ncbi:MAG: Hsp20/alpha crystallin family protein [Deltaproteobacteria bacterium]|nr:Hsp20/alpha crystallin family protein [Deltaproteobacteria bacterium]
MAIRNLVPSLWGKGNLPARQAGEYPVFSLQRELNQLFDDFFHGFDVSPFGLTEDRFQGFLPSVDVDESEKEVTVRIELPGMEEKDVDLLLTEDSLTIKGEKKKETQTREKEYYRMERTYGAFNRVIPLPDGIDTGQADASFKNGVLTVRIAKTATAKAKGKKIPIKTE